MKEWIHSLQIPSTGAPTFHSILYTVFGPNEMMSSDIPNRDGRFHGPSTSEEQVQQQYLEVCIVCDIES